MAKKPTNPDEPTLPSVNAGKIRKTTIVHEEKKSRAQLEREGKKFAYSKDKFYNNKETSDAKSVGEKLEKQKRAKDRLIELMEEQAEAAGLPKLSTGAKIRSTVSLMSYNEVAEILGEVALSELDELYKPKGVEPVKPTKAEKKSEVLNRKIVIEAARAIEEAEVIAGDTGVLQTNEDAFNEMTPESVMQARFESAGVATTARGLIEAFQEYEAAINKPEVPEEYLKAFKLIRATHLNPKMMIAGTKSFKKEEGLLHDNEGELIGADRLQGLEEVDVLSEEEWKMVKKGQHFDVVVGMIGKYANEVSGRERLQGEHYDPRTAFDVMSPTGPQGHPFVLSEEYSVALGMREPTDREQDIISRVKGVTGISSGVPISYDENDSLAVAGAAIGLPDVASKQQYLDAMAELYIDVGYTGEDRSQIKAQVSKYLDEALGEGFARVSASNKIQNQLIENSLKDWVNNGFEGELYKGRIQSYTSAFPSVEEVGKMFGDAIVDPLTSMGQDARAYREYGEDTVSSMLRVAAAKLRKPVDQMTERELYDATSLIGMKHATAMAAEKFWRVGGSSYEDSMSGKGMQKNYRNFGDEESEWFEGDLYGTEDHLQQILSDIDTILEDRGRGETRLDELFEEDRSDSDRFARDRLARIMDMHFEPLLTSADLGNLGVLREQIESELTDLLDVKRVQSHQYGLFDAPISIEQAQEEAALRASRPEDEGPDWDGKRAKERREVIEQYELEVEEEEEEEAARQRAALMSHAEDIDESSASAINVAMQGGISGTAKQYEQGSFNFSDAGPEHTLEEAPGVGRAASLGMTRGGAPLVEQTPLQTAAAPNVKINPDNQQDLFGQTRSQQEAAMLDKFFKANPHLERGPEQRTPEWYKARESQITSSNVGGFLSNANNAIKKRLSSIFTGKLHEQKGGPDIDRGIRLETDIKAEWEKRNPGLMLVDVGLVHNKKLNVGSTSPDAMIFDRETGEWTGKLAEIKAPRKIAEEGFALEAQRKKHEDQMQHQMLVMGAKGNTLIQGEERALVDTEGVGRRAGKNSKEMVLDESNLGADAIWQRDAIPKLQTAQRSLSMLHGLDQDQLNDMLDSNSQSITSSASGKLKILDNKTPYIFTEEHGKVLQQQDQDYIAKRGSNVGSTGDGLGAPRTKTQQLREEAQERARAKAEAKAAEKEEYDSSIAGMIGNAKGALLKKFAGPLAIAGLVGDTIDLVGKGAEGANNFIGKAYDMGMTPSDMTTKIGGMIGNGMTLGQTHTVMGQTQLMAGGMEVGMFDGAKRLVIATRGALTFEDIQQYGDDPQKLMELLRQRTGGQVSERGLMAMLSAGGVDTSLLRVGDHGMAQNYLAITNAAKTASVSNILGAGVALADGTNMEEIMGSLEGLGEGAPFKGDYESSGGRNAAPKDYSNYQSPDALPTSGSHGRNATSGHSSNKERVDVVVHVKADGDIGVAARRADQTVAGNIKGKQGRNNIGSSR